MRRLCMYLCVYVCVCVRQGDTGFITACQHNRLEVVQFLVATDAKTVLGQANNDGTPSLPMPYLSACVPPPNPRLTSHMLVVFLFFPYVPPCLLLLLCGFALACPPGAAGFCALDVRVWVCVAYACARAKGFGGVHVSVCLCVFV